MSEGIPFIGPSGEVLWKTLPENIQIGDETINVPDDIFVTNALCCHPRRKDSSKMLTATWACRERLLADVNAHPRKLVFALGNTAVWSLTGDSSSKITQIRGELITTAGEVRSEHGVLPLVHPAALLRGTGSYRQFRADIQYGVELLDGTFAKKTITAHHTVIRDKADAQRLRRRLMKRTAREGEVLLGADVETGGLDKHADKLLSLGLCYDPRHVYIIPVEFCNAKLINGIEGLRWIWHNGKFDIAFLQRYGMDVQVDHDTMLLSYANDERRGVHGLEVVAGDLLRAPNYKDMLEPYLPNKNSSYDVIPRDVLYEYQAKDVSLTLQIFHILLAKTQEDKHSDKLYHQVLIPAVALLHKVESVGLHIDLEALERNRLAFEQEMDELRDEFQEILGRPINMNSPSQMTPALYDELAIKTRHRNTREATLRLLNHPAISVLLKYRKVAKAYGTYVIGLTKHIAEDGKIRTTFNIHGTSTGRLSSSNPNLQNIPRESKLRDQFVPPPGYVFVEVDLSQAELRSLAALSGDEVLCDIFTSTDRSLHREVANRLFGENHTHDDYVRAKAVNFGIVYGRQARSLAEEFKTSVSEGQRMIDGWFETFPTALAFIEKCRHTPISGTTIVTAFGRRKRHNVVTPEQLHSLQNEAANFPHQSIASDITLQSACRMVLEDHPHAAPKLLDEFGTTIVNLVHDSVLLLVPNDQETITAVQKVAVECMETTAPLWGITRVPFTADTKIGYKWGSLKECTI